MKINIRRVKSSFILDRSQENHPSVIKVMNTVKRISYLSDKAFRMYYTICSNKLILGKRGRIQLYTYLIKVSL